MKKVILLLFLFVMSFFAVSAASCSVTTTCNSPNAIMMKLSSSTNAHGELASESNYNTYVCCDFAGTSTCDGSNTVLRLSSSTNAHAEIPTGSTYTSPVCYGNLDCTSGSSCPAGYDIQVASLSGNTNAHLADFASYPVKICCKEGAEPILKWYDETLNTPYTTSSISPLKLPKDSVIKLVIQNPHVSAGTQVSIKESDSGGGNITVLTTYFSGADLVADFVVSQAVFDASTKNLNGIYEFTYEISGEVSEILYFEREITQCENGVMDADETGVDCGGLTCSVCPETCDDGIQNQDETGIDCGGVCLSSCRQLFWTSSDDPFPRIDGPLIWTTADLYLNKKLRLFMQSPDLPSSATFTLKEDDDGLLQVDDRIFEDVAALDAGSGNVYYEWVVDINSFRTAENDDADNIYDFFFEAEGDVSPILQVQLDGPLPTCNDGIHNGDEEGEDCGGSCPDTCLCINKAVCSDYAAEGNCAGDPCDLANQSAIITGDLRCVWNDLTSTCAEVLSVSVNGIDIGNCLYNEDTSADTCDDGFLSYSWTSDWSWAPKNTFVILPEGDPADYVEEPDFSGEWHYDPQKAYLNCEDGSATIPCPAQIQLTFFTWKNLVAAIILIIVIYSIIRLKQKLAKKKKKIVRKKIIKKKTSAKKKVSRKKISKKKR